MLAFLTLVAWLASSRNKHRFDAAAQLPLEDDSVPTPINVTEKVTPPQHDKDSK